MKLVEVHINHFRNIIDSSPVKIEEDVTCLVGKNESGKTAFLHALYRLLPFRQNVEFSVHDHYPAWLEKRDRLKGKDLDRVLPVEAIFKLEEPEIYEVEERYGSGVIADASGNCLLTVSRQYDGTLCKTLQINEKTFVSHFLSSVSLSSKVIEELVNSESLDDLIELADRIVTRSNVGNSDKEILKNFKSNIEKFLGNNELDEAIGNVIAKYIPSFFYFDKYSTLPYSVKIKHLLKSDDSKLNDGELTARSLLRLAAADDEYLLTPNYERRKRELENVANALTDDVLQYWSQNPSLRVQPDITQKTETIPQGQQTVLDEIKFRIWDERHSLSLPINEHSSGFQWFFSFLAAFSEFEYRDDPVVILLDEPALGLHARAQKDYLRFIDERLAQRCQVIYSTHSPFMIQPGKLERARVVEDKGRDEGSKVSLDVLTTDSDTLFPLQGALGYDLAQHLFVGSHNLVVEGTSDFTYLSVLSDYFRALGTRMPLDERWTIVPVGGADLIPTFIALLGNHLDLTVLVDSRSTGNQKLEKLAEKGYLATTRIITIGEFLETRAGDIEDIFDVADYLNLYNRAFSDSLIETDLVGNDPIVSRIARIKGVSRFDHGRPSDELLRYRDELLPAFSTQTFDNFQALFERINSTLD